ncbi:MAG: hypothetical protein ACU84Q_13895 [Gammaproteobacteria bacterium]
MNWDAAGAIGEIVGAIAVVVTLLFLVRQLRQNTIALKLQSERASSDAIHNWSLTMMHPDVATAVSSSYFNEGDELKPYEMAATEHFSMSILIALQQDYFDWKRGYQSDELWASRAGLIEGVFASSYVRKWWATIGNRYVVPEFQDLVNEIIARPGARESDYWNEFKSA